MKDRAGSTDNENKKGCLGKSKDTLFYGVDHFLFWIMVARAGTNSLMTIREVLIIRS